MEKSLKEEVLTTLITHKHFKELPQHYQAKLIKEISNIYKHHEGKALPDNLYDDYYQEYYHSTSIGPIQEAYHKFVNPVLGLLKEKEEVYILDIGAGMFVNSGILAYELSKLNIKTNIISVDKKTTSFISLNHPSDEFRKSFYKNNFSIKSKNLNWQLILIDARKIRFESIFDGILHDGFSPYRNPSLWSLDFLNILYKSLKLGGAWVSYSSNKSLQGSLEFLGFDIEFIPSIGRKRPSIRAIKTLNPKPLPSKDPYKIPMRDINLNSKESYIIVDYFLRVYSLILLQKIEVLP